MYAGFVRTRAVIETALNRTEVTDIPENVEQEFVY